MTFTVTIIQRGHKPKIVTTDLHSRVSFEKIRKLLEAEEILNSLPAENLRIHFSLEDSNMDPIP